MNMSLETMVADTCSALGSAGEPIGPKQGGRPRFELFNAANSICLLTPTEN